MKTTSPTLLAFCITAALSAQAQTPTTASAVATNKPQETPAALPAEVSDTLVQQGQGTIGTIFNAGNVQGATGRVGGFYSLRYAQHGLRFDVGAGLAALASDGDGDPQNGFSKVDATGAVVGEANLLDNLNTSGFGKARYDYFLGDVGSVYAAGMLFHDSAVNLMARSRVDVGYRHFFFNVPKHSFSGEVGAVYTLDNAIFATEGADTNGDGRVFVWGDETKFETSGGVIGARLAVAYANALMDNVTFTQNLELIPNVSFGQGIPVVGDVDAPFEAARSGGEGDNRLGLGEATIVNAVSALTVNLGNNLAVGLNLNIVYDNGAVARRNAYTNHDVALSATLGYTFF